MLYLTAVFILLTILFLGIFDLLRTIKKWDTKNKTKPSVESINKMVWGPFSLQIDMFVKCNYLTYTGSSGVLEAYRAGQAFRVADTLYEEAERVRACLRQDDRQLPSEVLQTVLDDLHDGTDDQASKKRE